jgi:L-threonylcarbamoyladenylate synthase
MPTTTYPTEAEIERAAEILRKGGLVGFPTETVYGLGANALDPLAVEKIYAAKGRPPSSPLIVHVASVAMAQRVVAEWPERAALLAGRYWPGPLTLILRKQTIIPDRVTGGLDTVGVRIPAHPLALELIQRAGVPIAAPSANRFMQLSPTEAGHVRAGLGDRVDCILDGGPTRVGIESTVLSLDTDPPRLLRPGMITAAEIESVVGPVLRGAEDDSPIHASPGLHGKHYSPRTKVLITSDPPSGRGVYLWWKRESSDVPAIHMPSDPALYARELYAALHRLDGEKLDFIAIEPVPLSEEWDGISDRLTRASSEN